MINLLYLGIFFSMAGNYEFSNEILKKVSPSPQNQGVYYFYRAVNSYAANDKGETVKWCQLSLDFSKERRYTHIAEIMLIEAWQWKNGDLGDIGRDMGRVFNRLDQIDGGPTTRKIQEGIIEKLDRLIKEQEDAENSQAQAEAKSVPLPDSIIPADFGGQGKVDDKFLKKLQEEWGKLPPAERARAIQELDLKSPPKWKVMIEDYRKGLNKP